MFKHDSDYILFVCLDVHVQKPCHIDKQVEIKELLLLELDIIV